MLDKSDPTQANGAFNAPKQESRCKKHETSANQTKPQKEKMVVNEVSSETSYQSVKKVFFDRLAEVKEAPKTSNSHSSAYINTVEGELRSKSKRLV